MKINGIIAEYNPFHNGHKYQIENAKAATSADYTIVVMSGNFVQRGAPALLNKFKRAEAALTNGADLVLELPMYYAASSAEYFAAGAVSLLDKLNVIDNLCFGSECGDIGILQEIAKILATEPESYASALRQALRQGMSYPTARAMALTEYDSQLAKHHDIFSSPNNILGIEYLKAIYRRNSSINAYTTLRAGAGYHDADITCRYCSASGIRHAIAVNATSDAAIHLSEGAYNIPREQMPENAYDILSGCLEQRTFLDTNDLSAALHYKLLSEGSKGFAQYLDVTEDLSDRICNHLYEFRSFDSFCGLLKTKDMTYSRISRCLIHILLNMTTATMEQYRSMDDTPYARVLGFRKDAAPLLNAIKNNSSIPMITKLSDASEQLPENAWNMLKNDIEMNTIYESTVAQKSGNAMINEYRMPIVIV